MWHLDTGIRATNDDQLLHFGAVRRPYRMPQADCVADVAIRTVLLSTILHTCRSKVKLNRVELQVRLPSTCRDVTDLGA